MPWWLYCFTLCEIRKINVMLIIVPKDQKDISMTIIQISLCMKPTCNTLICNIYWEQIAFKQMGNVFSKYTKIGQSVRQRCIFLAADLLKPHSDRILKVLEDLPRFSISDKIRYTVLIAKSKAELQNLLR